jgi:hypothetical protein
MVALALLIAGRRQLIGSVFHRWTLSTVFPRHGVFWPVKTKGSGKYFVDF